MQFDKLKGRTENLYRQKMRRNGFLLTDDVFIEEPPICSPRNKNDLSKFFNFLNQFKNERYDNFKIKDNRWDCFLTDDFENTNGESNFCKQVLIKLESKDQLRNIKKNVCDGIGQLLLPKVFNSRSGLILNDIEKIQTEKKQRRMVYLDNNHEITEEDRKSSDVRVFQNWNDLTSGFLSVIFQEEYKCIRKGSSCRNIQIKRNLECGCIPVKYSRRNFSSNPIF